MALLRRPNWPLDTLFGRMAIFAMLVLFAVQLGWMTVLTIQRPRHDADGYARGILMVMDAVHSDDMRGAKVSSVHGVSLQPESLRPTNAQWVQADEHMTQLLAEIKRALPPGSDARVTGHAPSLQLWVHYAGSRNWIVTDIHPPPSPPIVIESIAMLLAAIVLSLGAAWQMQRPMARVAQVTQRFGKGERPLPLEEKGPREMRELIHAVNQMMQQISRGEDEKALMLAGIAHDLKAPLTRMKLRASVLDDENDRIQFTRDVDSLTHIVQQFLEFAGSEPSDGPDIKVDNFLAEQFATPTGGDESLFVHRLDAGPGFILPRTLIDRLATNLVDNAFEHGEAPVEITTMRQGDDWVLEVRDHGRGIPDELIEEASKPFARLDPARSGDGHCGLGLAIVSRLAFKKGGRCELSNAPGGGLSARIVLPAAFAQGSFGCQVLDAGVVATGAVV